METINVYLDGITVNDRLRKLDAKKVKGLAESIKAIGLQQPIHVWKESEDNIVLVAGRHRLAAVKKLGWEQIECVFTGLGDSDRRLWEIDENLMRADLTELELADHLERRQKIWEARRSSGENFRETSPRGGRPKEFDQDTADKTGMDKSTIRKSRRRAKKIAPDVQESIKDMPAADKGVELDALADLEPEEQRQAVERVQSGASDSFRDAAAFIRGAIRAQPLPTAIRARQIASKSGTPVLARDGKIYFGATKKEGERAAERRELIYGAQQAINHLANMEVTPAEWLAEVRDWQFYRFNTNGELEKARDWLGELQDEWGKRND